MAVMFSFLDGISPWWWVAFALALGALELVTFSYFLLWLALAAVSVAGVLVVADLGGTSQVALFAICALVYTLVGYAIVKKRGPSEQDGPLNNRAAALIGRKAVVAGPFQADMGPVEVDGIRWRGRLAPGTTTPAEGEELEITATEGMLLQLRRSS
ncbi:MAG: NfeD family protein [Pseudomonadota bacterium]